MFCIIYMIQLSEYANASWIWVHQNPILKEFEEENRLYFLGHDLQVVIILITLTPRTILKSI